MASGPSERGRHRHEKALAGLQPPQHGASPSSSAPPHTPTFSASNGSSVQIVARLLNPFAAVVFLCSLLAYLAFTQARSSPATTGLLLSRAPSANRTAARALSDPEAAKTARFDKDARVVRLDFTAGERSVDPRQDSRGWMIDPLTAAREAGLTAGSTSCLVVHLGEVLPGRTRGNHRHHSYNETLVLWGARMKLRNENRNIPKGYAEVILAADDVAVVAGPAKHAHAISNIDERRPAYLVACQDGRHDPQHPDSDYGVWQDL